MILIFDLDDTLYVEKSYVESGFLAVAKWLEIEFGWHKTDSLERLIEILDKFGRGEVFNRFLIEKNLFYKPLLNNCVKIYRSHLPNIQISENTYNLLISLPWSKYIVTDGNKIMQKNKIDALKIEGLFKKVFITHRYGIKNAKPSIYCFNIIKQMENCLWSDMWYIGDNPYKDFVNLTPLGVNTVRVLTGMYKKSNVKKEFEAKFIISDLTQLADLFEKERI